MQSGQPLPDGDNPIFRKQQAPDDAAPFSSNLMANRMANLMESLSEIERLWAGEHVERSCAIHRKTSHQCWEIQHFETGTAHAAAVDIKAFARAIILNESDAIILCHYHPFGSTKPSNPDLRTTRSLSDFCNILDVSLIDHIIFGRGPCFSFRVADYL